jgi:hypothetical protein
MNAADGTQDLNPRAPLLIPPAARAAAKNASICSRGACVERNMDARQRQIGLDQPEIAAGVGAFPGPSATPKSAADAVSFHSS